MKIKIHTHDLKHDINLALPTSIVLSDLSARICSGVIDGKCEADVPAEVMRRIFGILRKFKRENPDFVLVEVSTSGGEQIVIKL